MSTTEDAVVDHLAANVTAVALTAGENVRNGPVMQATTSGTSATRAIPGECVFVQETGGIKGVVYNGNLDAVEPEFTNLIQGEAFPSVQIWVRSKPNDYSGGHALAEDCLRVIDRKPPVGFFDAQVVGSSPNQVRKDAQDRFEFSINVDLRQQRR